MLYVYLMNFYAVIVLKKKEMEWGKESMYEAL
ncbi:Uncharacterised protein [Acinetobacter baumannii]|nr:Uncharacterised protein [Acinetobacter baumannii]